MATKKRACVVFTQLHEGEVMKSIHGFPHYYITNQGRVLSTRPLGGSKTPTPLREIKLSLGVKPYYYCNIYPTSGKRKSFRVNRLVYEYHNRYGESLKVELVVDHFDRNKKNNHINNLRQITYKQNTEHYQLSKKKI